MVKRENEGGSIVRVGGREGGSGEERERERRACREEDRVIDANWLKFGWYGVVLFA